ncbi:MAG: class II aldolase/adducin family protein [candidate division WOR-3 bacterium]|jgi:rhamnulose-1-phosphate aldolase|nr:class II aldolase/adducin family protein [candidate division WOR-3 bacterium]MDH7518966.1 class II aldolase/adducin family protein [bacterium]
MVPAPKPNPDWVKIVQRYIPALARTAARLSASGWAEKNAGNFSIRINEYLLTKITGYSMSQIARDPFPYICLVKPNKVGFRYRVSPPGVKPTEELPTHILGQRILTAFRPQEIVLLHTHPTEIVHLTRIFPHPRTLLQKLTALDGKIPGGFAVVPFLKPGSISLARATARALKTNRLVIWINHGAIASGKTLFEAFRLIWQFNNLTRKLLDSR